MAANKVAKKMGLFIASLPLRDQFALKILAQSHPLIGDEPMCRLP
jgi:hypothetical protein